MAERLNSWRQHLGLQWLNGILRAGAPRSLGVLMLLALGMPCRAEGLVDPTRPPAEFLAPQPGGAEGKGGAPVLQSVIISPQRKAAVINGQTVSLGDSFGDARLVKITESEVVLRSGETVQTLKLFPAVEKHPVNSGKARKKPLNPR